MRGGIGRMWRKTSYRLFKLLWSSFDEGRDRENVGENQLQIM